MEAIHSSNQDNGSGTTNETSYKITGKAGNGMRQVRTHTWAPGISPKLKSLQDLSIRINPEVTEEVVQHAGMFVDGCLHFRLHGLSKWFCDTSTGAAQEQPVVVLLRGRPLASWLLALGERGGHGNLCGSGRLSITPYVHERTELYCAQACLA
jgi:hypothetical protein